MTPCSNIVTSVVTVINRLSTKICFRVPGASETTLALEITANGIRILRTTSDIFDLYCRLSPDEEDYRKRVRHSCVAGIRRAQDRKVQRGTPALVDLTSRPIVGLLERHDYRCELTGLGFWQDESDRFGPTMPTIDRKETDGPYSLGNVRIVLHGVSSLRGRGSDQDMYRIASALLASRR